MTVSAFSLDALEVNYLTDEQGKKTGVLLSMEDWLNIKKLLERSLLKEDLLHALQEMQDMRDGLRPKLTLNDVINEL